MIRRQNKNMSVGGVHRRRLLSSSPSSSAIILMLSLESLLAFTLVSISSVNGFLVPLSSTYNNLQIHQCQQLQQHQRQKEQTSGTSILRMSSNNHDEEEMQEEEFLMEEEDESMLVADVRGRPAGVVIEDLNWRVEKLRLEEANTRRFLKAGPRFLPYDECRKWVQAWGNRWRSSTEWYVCLHPYTFVCVSWTIIAIGFVTGGACN